MQSLSQSHKHAIIEDMLWKYSSPDLFIQGSEPIDFDSHFICYSFTEFDQEAQQITQQTDTLRTVVLFENSNSIPLALSSALRTMLKGEQAFFELSEVYALTQKEIDCLMEDLTPLKMQRRQYWLIKIENSFEYLGINSLNQQQIEQYIEEVRKYAGSIFQQSNYRSAISIYELIGRIKVGEHSKKILKEISKSFSNRAVCYIKLKEWGMADQMCDEAFSFDNENEKGRASEVKQLC
ncbi:unnamed protein product (macronuclear) [Paramecium tetraurelia]|uniref:Tetratricopeptide repeat protein n=1 Tax=Paramecium tetraurelia TaxID=5888 RepID=A0C1Z9_PARTE|nr:uncharacterized protein GSPATT00034293001 [Paramecium tetraurelia]CAK64816.1 unnamed protein product [Paramecium tetraurelia]|eukprot:XP_001432213.1 hypothetical protein (macronuclear) [Paramecium tetraurelia strain d4-2]